MGYILLWIESVTMAVLVVATVTAWAARRRRPWLRVALPLAAAIVVLAKIGAFVAGSVWMRVNHLVPDWLVYTLSWTIVFAVAAAVVLARGLRLREGERAARQWPAGRLFVGCVAAMALHLVTFYNLDLSAEIQLAAAKAASGALALTAAPARVPDHQNAALVYRRAFDSIHEFEDLPAEWVEKWMTWVCDESRTSLQEGEPPPPPFDPADPGLRKFLGEHQRTLVLLRQAAAMHDCYFERSWGQPSIDMLLPEYTLLQSSVRLLALDARVRLADGDARGAVDDLNAISGMAAHIRSEPLLIATLVAMMADNVGHMTLTEALASGKLGPDDLAAIRLDENLSYMRALGRSFQMEEAFGLSCFTFLSPDADYNVLAVTGSSLSRLSPTIMAPALSVWRVFLMPVDMASYRRTLHQYREWCAKPYYRNREAWEEAHEAFQTQRHGILTAMVLPALSHAVVRVAEAQAGHELARTALAAARYRAKTGQWPARLADLVPDYLPEVPVDPFDGKPLRMATKDGRIVLYSVGRNGKDDGGREGGKDGADDDILFRLPAK